MKDIKKKKLKVFHGLVNYGTQAGMLAKGLRDVGVEAFSVSTPDPSQRLIDFELLHGGSFLQKVKKHSINKILKIRWFFKYDLFHFYFGRTLMPYNLDLYFYRLFGKKVVMEYLGHDVDLCLGMNGLDYRNRICDRIKKIKRIKFQAKWVDKQLVCSPYYYQFVDNSIILPLALDISEYEYTPRVNEDKFITIMHCPTNRTYKKSDYIEDAVYKLIKEGYKINYKCITNVTHAKLKEEFISSDLVIDQLNHWYGTVTIEAMALGRPVICGYNKHLTYYDYEKSKDLPIINADHYNIYDVLKDVMENKYNLVEIGLKSREFVEKVHDLKIVTNELVAIYEDL